jgi:hypothetical protein
VLEKFGITVSKLGISAHGLRQEALIEAFVAQSGQQPPVRGGAAFTAEAEDAAWLAVSRLAGHERRRAASAPGGGEVSQQGPREAWTGGSAAPR